MFRAITSYLELLRLILMRSEPVVYIYSELFRTIPILLLEKSSIASTPAGPTFASNLPVLGFDEGKLRLPLPASGHLMADHFWARGYGTRVG